MLTPEQAETCARESIANWNVEQVAHGDEAAQFSFDDLAPAVRRYIIASAVVATVLTRHLQARWGHFESYVPAHN